MASNLYRNIFKKTPAGDIADNFNVEGELNFGVINRAWCFFLTNTLP